MDNKILHQEGEEVEVRVLTEKQMDDEARGYGHSTGYARNDNATLERWCADHDMPLVGIPGRVITIEDHDEPEELDDDCAPYMVKVNDEYGNSIRLWVTRAHLTQRDDTRKLKDVGGF